MEHFATSLLKHEDKYPNNLFDLSCPFIGDAVGTKYINTFAHTTTPELVFFIRHIFTPTHHCVTILYSGCSHMNQTSRNICVPLPYVQFTCSNIYFGSRVKRNTLFSSKLINVLKRFHIIAKSIA